MAIYIDDYNAKFGRMIMCHMLSDTSLEELHLFADSIGMRREWFQNGSAPHYDVSKEKKALALKKGAISLPIRIGSKFNPLWREIYNKAKLIS